MLHRISYNYVKAIINALFFYLLGIRSKFSHIVIFYHVTRSNGLVTSQILGIRLILFLCINGKINRRKICYRIIE